MTSTTNIKQYEMFKDLICSKWLEPTLLSLSRIMHATWWDSHVHTTSGSELRGSKIYKLWFYCE